MGGSIADGSQYLDDDGMDAIGAGWRIPALVDGSGCASWSFLIAFYLFTSHYTNLGNYI